MGEAVGSSLDLDEVLDQIVSNAVRLTNLGFGDITLSTDGGSIMEYDESDDSFHVRAAFGSSPALLEQLRAITIDRGIDRWSAGPRCRPQAAGGRPTWRWRRTSTPIWTSCSATAGARCSRFRCCAATRWSACW